MYIYISAPSSQREKVYYVFVVSYVCLCLYINWMWCNWCLWLFLNEEVLYVHVRYLMPITTPDLALPLPSTSTLPSPSLQSKHTPLYLHDQHLSFSTIIPSTLAPAAFPYYPCHFSVIDAHPLMFLKASNFICFQSGVIALRGGCVCMLGSRSSAGRVCVWVCVCGVLCSVCEHLKQ